MKSCPSCQSTYPGHFSMCPRDGTALVEAEEWSSGMVIRGKYRILNKIGQGGMGGVYKAHHVMFEELRALKVMNPDLLGDAVFVRRFKQEAVIARKLQHANTVRVDDIDEAEDGRPFIVMEYIEGESLKSVIQEQGRLPVERACSIAKQVAAALDAAHQLGMVHRDIKPANIVLVHTPAGEQAKVLDFGIAKLKEAHATEAAGLTLTGTGIVIGTPQYMSPEQAAGKRGDQLDGRSDIYSLGVVMYQMLTGELPFKADTTIELILAQINTPPRPILEVHPDLNIPPAVAQLVMQCLEKKPEMRPPSGNSFISQIESAGDIKWEWETAPTRTTSFAPPPAATGEVQKAIAERNKRVAQPGEDQLSRPSTDTRPKQEMRFRSGEHALAVSSIPEFPPVGAPAGKSRRWVLPVAAALVIAAGMAAWRFEIRRHVARINLAASERSHPASNRNSAGSLTSQSNSSSAPNTKQSAATSPSAFSSVAAQHSENPSGFTLPPSQGGKNVRHPVGQTVRQRFIRNRETVAALRPDERPAGGDQPVSPRQVENPSMAGLVVSTAPGAAVFVDGKQVGKADNKGQLTVYDLKPGAHGLRVALAGYPDIEYSVQSAPGGTTVVTAKWEGSETLRTNAAVLGNSNGSSAKPFTATFAVIHEHVIGGDKGILVVRNDSIQFQADKGKDSFISPLDGINWGKNRKGEFFVRLVDGRTYTFRSTSTSAIISAIQQAISKPGQS